MWPPLRKLNVESNALQTLSMLLVSRWDKLEELRLTDNQWSCDCRNQYLVSSDKGTRESRRGRGKKMGSHRSSLDRD